MASNDASKDRQIYQQSVSCQDDLEPVPTSPESQSFVVIKSAQDLESIDDNDIPDFSMTFEHKNIIHEELAHFETFSNNPQPSVNSYVFANNPVNASTADLNRSQASTETNKPFAKGINNEEPSDTIISIADFSRSDFCSEGIQEKVYQLIEENMRVKATLIQNNKSMSAQYNFVAEWRNDVDRVHLANKQVIETLKTEVAALKNENELLRQAHASNNKIQNDVTESKLYIAAREKVQELEEAFEKLTICNKNETAESSKKIQQLEEALASSTQNQNALDIYEGKVKTLEEALQNITIKASQDLSCEADKLKNVEMKLALCEAELKTALQKISCHLEKQLIDAEVIKETLAEKARLIAELDAKTSQSLDDQATIQSLRQELCQTEETVKDAKKREEEAKVDAWMSKQRIKKTLEQKLQLDQSAYVCADELKLVEQQLMQSQIALTECNQKQAESEGNIASLSLLLTEKQEEQFALVAQLKMYETDFITECEAKEEVKRENCRMVEDLQQLFNRNQQLQEEVELLREQLTQMGVRVAERRLSSSEPSRTSSGVSKFDS